VDAHCPLLLLSGLPLARNPSFLRQLDSLAAVWRGQGRIVLLGGPVFPDPQSQMRQIARAGKTVGDPHWRLAGSSGEPLSMEELLSRTVVQAMILLGYPDQFPFLYGSIQTTPSYLWSQFSRPPKGVLPQSPIYIPLTEKTAAHLRAVGCSRLGPVIPHGVNAAVFTPPGKQVPGRANTFVVGTVANNSRRKRLDLIIRSFALFSRERPHSRLLIRTNRPVSLDGLDLPDLIARENLEHRVEIILAELTGSRMAELYNRMDLYLNLSEWEGFCIPAIEAMACSVPVVSPPIQGPGEILPYSDTLIPDCRIHEEDGTLLYEADPRVVSTVLCGLADDRELRQRLGREGREAVLSCYDMRRVAAQWDGLLQRM